MLVEGLGTRLWAAIRGPGFGASILTSLAVGTASAFLTLALAIVLGMARAEPPPHHR